MMSVTRDGTTKPIAGPPLYMYGYKHVAGDLIREENDVSGTNAALCLSKAERINE